MNRKIFVLVLISIFFIASVGFISAEDNLNDIHVKKVWKDAGFESNRPDSVQVLLFIDEKLINSTILNESNGWQAIFKDVDVSGNVKIVENNSSSDYNISYSGNVKDGFVITSTILKNAKNNDSSGNKNKTDNVIVENKTDKNSTDDNKTNPSDKNSSDKGNSSDDGTTVDVDVNSTVTVKEVNDEKKPPQKPKTDDTLIELKNTGIPAVVLLISIIGAVLIPFVRRKD